MLMQKSDKIAKDLINTPKSRNNKNPKNSLSSQTDQQFHFLRKQAPRRA